MRTNMELLFPKTASLDGRTKHTQQQKNGTNTQTARMKRNSTWGTRDMYVKCPTDNGLKKMDAGVNRRGEGARRREDFMIIQGDGWCG